MLSFDPFYPYFTVNLEVYQQQSFTQGYMFSPFWMMISWLSQLLISVLFLFSIFSLYAVCATFVMVLGKLLFGFILGTIASTLSNAEATKVAYEEKLEAVTVNIPLWSLTKEVKPRLDKRPLVFNGRLANCGLTFLLKEVTVEGVFCTHAEPSSNFLHQSHCRFMFTASANLQPHEKLFWKVRKAQWRSHITRLYVTSSCTHSLGR